MEEKFCSSCGTVKALNDDNWYRARPTTTHPKGGWQSHCKECWKVVNSNNKQRRKDQDKPDATMPETSRA